MLSKNDQDIFYKRLGATIKSARKHADLTQQDIADFLELKRTSVVNIEQGTQRIQLHSLLEVAFLLKINPYELLVKLYVLIEKSNTASANEQKAINKVAVQFTNKEANSEILKEFAMFSKYKT